MAAVSLAVGGKKIFDITLQLPRALTSLSLAFMMRFQHEKR